MMARWLPPRNAIVSLATGSVGPAVAERLLRSGELLRLSREVVQPLPSEEVQRLNRSLVALAKAPRDLDALVEAGNAAMGVDDLEAAIGFFGRAADVDPGHPGVARGLGAVYLRSGRAGEALVQFDKALAAGVTEQSLLTDRALTLDLVGEHPAAQAAYLRAIEADPGDERGDRHEGKG